MKHILSLITLLFSCLLLSCGHDEVEKKPAPPDEKADHTFLLYLCGDHPKNNDLSPSLERNESDAQNAILNTVENGTINLVIFKDVNTSGNSLPQLYWVRKNAKNRLDTIPLKTYDKEIDATSKEVFEEVLDITFNQQFKDSKFKGLSFGSHALGWSQSDNYTYSRSTRSTQYIGQDIDTGTGKTGYMEVWDFEKAIDNANVKLNYIIFDACNMGNIEIAYMLRDRTDYIVAAPTEIMGDGFPYQQSIKTLSEVRQEKDFCEALTKCATQYFEARKYSKGATISVYDVSKITQLYNDFFSLYQSSPKLPELKYYMDADLYEMQNWQTQFQQFGRSYVGADRLFYDFAQFVSYLDPDGQQGSKVVLDDLQQFIVSKLYTDKFFAIEIKECCGITISIPPAMLNEKRRSAYAELEWGARMFEPLKK